MSVCSDTHSDRLEQEDGSCTVTVVDVGTVTRVEGSLSPERVIDRTTAIFAALADPTRFRILEALASAELCVCDLAAVAGVSQSAVSHQLRLLRDRELVAYRREGNRAVYRLADEHVRDLIAIGVQHAMESGAS